MKAEANVDRQDAVEQTSRDLVAPDVQQVLHPHSVQVAAEQQLTLEGWLTWRCSSQACSTRTLT